jgi:hypothetical protein
MNIVQRFLNKIKPMPDGCWHWTAYRDAGGYGSFGINGRMRPAHRAMWWITHGPVPNGLHVLHKCDVPKCVNPEHLKLGTHADNMNDKKTKGRSRNGSNKQSQAF